MKTILRLICMVLIAGFLSAAPAEAIVYDITMTVDNYYRLYTGTPGSLTYIGKTEGEWGTAESYSPDLVSGNYIYVLGWDTGNIEGFLGQFNSTDTNYESFITHVGQGWEAAPVTVGPYTNVDDPVVIDTAIGYAGTMNLWNPVQDYRARNLWPYEPTGGIDPNAVWIWGDECDECCHDAFLFRREIPDNTIPEPASMVLLGTGLLGLALRRKKK